MPRPPAVLTKTMSVLHRIEGTTFRHDDDVEDDGALEVVLHLDTWIDFGRPDTITVSIEPRDLLNDEG